MLCAMFKSTLVIAAPRNGLDVFDVVASIPLADASIEDVDGGKGLQCHTAPYSWKLVFEYQYRLFELLMSACSPIEEARWREQLHERSCIEVLENCEAAAVTQDLCSSLSLDLKSVGTLHGSAAAGSRGISIHRAVTLGARSQMISQVIIKNTESPEHTPPFLSSAATLPLSRSKSVASAGYIPVLCPRRTDRVQLEAVLADAWTKDMLPYPGMKQTENAFRASAHHLMRKLSMASISSTFSRKSTHHPPASKDHSRSATPTQFSMPIPTQQVRFSKPAMNRSAPQMPSFTRSPTAPPAVMVDFHSTPEMFLPPDFEIKDPRLAKQKHGRSTIRAVSAEGGVFANAESQRLASTLKRSVSTHLPTLHESSLIGRPPTSALRRKGEQDATSKSRPLGDITKSVQNRMTAPKSTATLRSHLRKLFSASGDNPSD